MSENLDKNGDEDELDELFSLRDLGLDESSAGTESKSPSASPSGALAGVSHSPVVMLCSAAVLRRHGPLPGWKGRQRPWQ